MRDSSSGNGDSTLAGVQFSAALAMTGRWIVFPLGLLVVLSGCASRSKLMYEVRTAVSTSQYDKAYRTYAKKVKGTDEVDKLLNLGLLAYEARDYATAQRALADADRLAEERLTKSLSREAAGLAVSDRVRAYQGTVFDRAVLHYYRALAFLAQGNPDAAAVEGRKIAQYLEVNSRESKHSYQDDAFLQWFSGSLYERAGQVNDAWISYKRARAVYQDFYGLSEPDFLCPVTYGAAHRAGVGEFEPALKELCPDAVEKWNPDYGRVVVLCEAGIAPPILEENISFPILKRDHRDWHGDDDYFLSGEEVYHRGHQYHYESVELDYFVRVALPYYPEPYTGSRVTSVTVRAEDGREFAAELSTDFGAILRKDLRDRMPAITIRAIARGIFKYTVTKTAENQAKKDDKTFGEILGFALNVAGAASEAADTRSWETLPDRIYVADFQLPPGEYSLRTLFEDGSGATLRRADFEPITVTGGEVIFLRARCAQ